MEEELKKIIKYAEEVAGQWNGDDYSSAEDRAMIANEIIEHCDEVISLLKEL